LRVSRFYSNELFITDRRRPSHQNLVLIKAFLINGKKSGLRKWGLLAKVNSIGKGMSATLP
ncbi:hypothetical protein VZ94_13735, partial [Methylocucumis oryzae]